MNGRTLRVIPRHQFDFSHLVGQASDSRTLAGRIDASQFTQAELIVRTHARDIEQANAKLRVELVRDGYTDEDPAQPFISTSALTTIDIVPGTTPGTMQVSSVVTNLGSMLAVRVVGVADTSAGDLMADLSVDLVLKAA